MIWRCAGARRRARRRVAEPVEGVGGVLAPRLGVRERVAPQPLALQRLVQLDDARGRDASSSGAGAGSTRTSDFRKSGFQIDDRGRSSQARPRPYDWDGIICG